MCCVTRETKHDAILGNMRAGTSTLEVTQDRRALGDTPALARPGGVCQTNLASGPITLIRLVVLGPENTEPN